MLLALLKGYTLHKIPAFNCPIVSRLHFRPHLSLEDLRTSVVTVFRPRRNWKISSSLKDSFILENNLFMVKIQQGVVQMNGAH